MRISGDSSNIIEVWSKFNNLKTITEVDKANIHKENKNDREEKIYSILFQIAKMNAENSDCDAENLKTILNIQNEISFKRALTAEQIEEIANKALENQ